jgi:hypothetical protein
MGVLDRLFEAVALEPDLEWLAIDATVIRAQAQAAGARRKKGGPQAQALGRSRSGFGTKLYAVVDALGLPVRFAIEQGQQNDMAPACGLVAGPASSKVIADRLHDVILDEGGEMALRQRLPSIFATLSKALRSPDHASLAARG